MANASNQKMVLCTFSLPLQSHLAIPEDAPFFFTIDGRLVSIHGPRLDP
jgi:hypothetical protein